MKWNRTALILFSILAAGQPLRAASIDEAKTAFQAGDYEHALRIWRPLAEHGDASAQFGLGVMYYHGYHLRLDKLLRSIL